MSREETGIDRRRELGPPRKPLFHANKALVCLMSSLMAHTGEPCTNLASFQEDSWVHDATQDGDVHPNPGPSTQRNNRR